MIVNDGFYHFSMTRHFDLKIKVGHCDIYLMVQWFSLISWRLFDIWISYFRIMSQYDLTFDLKINVGHCDLYFMVQWFCLISWSLFGIWTPYFGIMSQFLVWFLFYGPSTHFRSFRARSVNLATLFLGKPPRQFTRLPKWSKINVDHCDLYFMVQWICLISWKLFSSWTLYFGTMSQYDPTSDLRIFKGHCDLYFIVQWFCLISWRLFDVWTLYFVIMSQCNTVFALKQCRSQWFIFSWSIDFAINLK